ncbi:MAG: UDP-glucose/GDP-mannose dehydrogenase family protein [Rickettsiales bacterium]|jgi:UDPglucose 6-dehydrogenase|nr:UDP-glucose/GDP-mannose dehydrogenase family protein [Rickettsiales bacterium]
MKIAVIGTGYVGLPTGAGFAELGHDVVCIDKDKNKIGDLNAGRITLFEDGLEELFHKNAASGKLSFTTDISSVKDADFVLIAVGTPPHPVTKEADLRYIYAAAEEIAPHLSGYTVVADKSTVPVGTGDKVEEIIRAKNPAADFDVISMPEFLREGFAVRDFFHPDRIVAGTDSERARAAVGELYSAFPEKQDILFADRRSAEMIKYASNAFLSIKIHYINEIADLCEKVGANAYDVARGVGLDSRIGSKFLNPGPGFGGSCFPKDADALLQIARYADVDLSLVNAAISGNDERTSKMAARIMNAVKNIENPKIAVWGLAFKGGTDDVRSSPAIRIVQTMANRGAAITAFDPKAMENARAVLGGAVSYAGDAVGAAGGADVLAVLTEWDDFKSIDTADLEMRTKKIVDLRHVIDGDAARANGFEYETIGIKNE